MRGAESAVYEPWAPVPSRASNTESFRLAPVAEKPTAFASPRPATVPYPGASPSVSSLGPDPTKNVPLVSSKERTVPLSNRVPSPSGSLTPETSPRVMTSVALPNMTPPISTPNVPPISNAAEELVRSNPAEANGFAVMPPWVQSSLGAPSPLEELRRKWSWVAIIVTDSIPCKVAPAIVASTPV